MMELPNRHLAHVPEAKITRYLLDLNHPYGWGKAQEFRKRGYNESNVDAMSRDLIAIVQSQPVTVIKENAYGLKYEMHGIIHPPIGGDLLVITVWMIDHGGNAPKLVTAYSQERE